MHETLRILRRFHGTDRQYYCRRSRCQYRVLVQVNLETIILILDGGGSGSVSVIVRMIGVIFLCIPNLIQIEKLFVLMRVIGHHE